MNVFKKYPIYRVAAVFVAALMTLATTRPIGWAASHREAPLIAIGSDSSRHAEPAFLQPLSEN